MLRTACAPSETGESNEKQQAACWLGNELQKAPDFATRKFSRVDIPIGAARAQSGGERDFGCRIGSAVRGNIGRVPARRLRQIQDVVIAAGGNVQRKAGECGCRRGDTRGSLERERGCRVNMGRRGSSTCIGG